MDDSEETLVPPKSNVPYKYYSCYAISFYIASTFITWGPYWVFDTPGALFYQLQKWFGGSSYTNADSANFYAVVSFPNLVLALCSGYILDRWTGISGGAILFGTLSLGGQVLFALGVEWKSYWTALVGRGVYGVGNSALGLCQAAYIYRWFRPGPSVGLMFGILSLIINASALNFWAQPAAAEANGIMFAIWFGTAQCVASYILTIVIACLDWAGQDILDRRAQDRKALKAFGQTEVNEQREEFSIKNLRLLPVTFWWFVFSGSLFSTALYSFQQIGGNIIQNMGEFSKIYDQLPAPEVYAECTDHNGDPPSYFQTDMAQEDCESFCSTTLDCSGYQFNASSASTSCFLFGVVTPELNGSYVPQAGGSHVVTAANEVEENIICFKRGRQFTALEASSFLMIPNGVGLLTPIGGWVIDRFGRALNTILAAAVLSLLVYGGFLINAMEWWSIHPVLLMTCHGVALSMLQVSEGPAFALIIPSNVVGTALGTKGSLGALISTGWTLIVGAVQTYYRGSNAEYLSACLMYFGITIFAGILTCIVWFLDRKHGAGFSIMNSSVPERASRASSSTGD